MSKIIFMKYLPPVRPKMIQKVKNPQNLLKFGTPNISSMRIYILIPKIIFMKYLLSVRPKLVAKLKMLGIY